MVLPAVLSVGITLFAAPVAKTAGSSVVQRDPDVARLVALINAAPVRESLDGVRNITVHINKMGKAKKILVQKPKNASAAKVEDSIKQANFSGHPRGKKIQLVFNQPSPKVTQARRTQ